MTDEARAELQARRDAGLVARHEQRLARAREPMIEPVRKTQADLEEQRAKGWPDWHPEDYCHRCGMPNISWWIDSAVWNAVMRPEGPGSRWRWNEIICPVCFVHLAGGGTFELRVDSRTRSGRELLARIEVGT